MGVDTRRPILPAPTESIVDTNGSITGTDLATDISRRTDKTSYSIPDDGSPVTIPTRRKHRSRGDDSKLSRSSQHSQTSLLIEYFEGGKGSGSLTSRPSVRVRVTPSSARKLKDQKDHIQITESSGNRKPVYSRRISLSSPHKHKSLEESAVDDSSSNSATDENQPPGHSPLEIELMNRDQGSELSALSRDRYFHPTSDISSMPADSMLEAPSSGPRRKRSQSLERESKEYLKTPRRQRSRSLSTERIAHRVAEKLSNDPRDVSRQRRRAERSRFEDGSDLQDMDSKSPRRRALPDDMMSPESSLLSASAVSSHRRSGDQYSFKSGTSKSSINNPKLLETVEDAIRRLILPELKELKKDQKVITNTSKFERDMNTSHSSASTPSRDELGRRLSKHASAPDVRKPKVVLNKDSRDEGIVLSGDSVPSQKERRSSKDSERSHGRSEKSQDLGYIRWANRPELTEQEKLRRQKSKGLRDAEKAALVGTALTAAALQHHDSRSSLGKSEGRRKSSGARSRTGSINETELVFQKHNVAPMPLRSAIESDLTRASLLSEQTAEPAAPYGDTKFHEGFRGSPFQSLSPAPLSPAPRTPNRTPLDVRHELKLKHSNLSSHDLSMHSPSSRSPVGDAAAGAIAAAAAANLLDSHSENHDLDYSDLASRRRTLSPIQSVASNESQSPVKRDLTHYDSTDFARSTRPEGLSITSQTESLRRRQEPGPELGYEETPRPSPREERHWEEYSDDDEDQHSLAETETQSTVGKRMTGYTDDSELDHHDQEDQGRPVAEGLAANPRFVHPMAVESAVASVLEPTILDTKSSQSGANRSMAGIPEQEEEDWEPEPLEQHEQHEQHEPAEHESHRGSPLKQREEVSSPDATSFPRRMGATSPPQSVTQSLDDHYQNEPAPLFAGDLDSSPMPHEDDRSPDSESEINTNPSIIQGPAAHENSWSFNRTPSKDAPSPLFDKSGAGAGAGLGLGSVEPSHYGQDYYPEDDYGANDYYDQQYHGGQMLGTPLGAKDEGYVSAANPRSPSVETPEPLSKGIAGIDTNGMGLFDSPLGGEDHFMPGHQRQLSGYSQGVGSPLYDSATGKGIDRIQSKDIVALMDHLTVRDAQRNARDTEILVTLVRSAAEMRNSFEEMKKFIALQDGMLMEASDRQHERTYRALGGPRPQPVSTRSARQVPIDDGDDMRSKRKNIFKRALKGLSLKNSNDLTRIEDMLEQLLDEVEALRYGQDDRYMRGGNRAASVDPEGYEPEGHAGTSSPGNQSEYLSTSSQPVLEPLVGNGLRRGMENRVSTVPELDEDIDEQEFPSPTMPSQEPANNRQGRAGSAPVSTPPREPMASGALSNEATPKTTEKAKKHKSSSSSFFPKISRWSKTTASSMGDNIRNSIQPGRSKERASFDTSRSGSEAAPGPYKPDYYDPQGEDRLRSTYTLEDPQQENRPPSPLVPSQASGQASEAPKYRAHRGSLDLHHPQPRQGPSGRYQNQLETQAQVYGVPAGAPSDQWGSNPSLSGVNANPRYSGASRLSPISDAGYSEASSRHTGPPRPPKIKDEGPLIPERPPKVKEDDERSYMERVASRSSIMRSPRSTPPPRKPTGPRPLTSGSQFSPARRQRSQYRASPEQVDADHDY